MRSPKPSTTVNPTSATLGSSTWCAATSAARRWAGKTGHRRSLVASAPGMGGRRFEMLSFGVGVAVGLVVGLMVALLLLTVAATEAEREAKERGEW
jgi:anti-sigma factor RsiW